MTASEIPTPESMQAVWRRQGWRFATWGPLIGFSIFAAWALAESYRLSVRPPGIAELIDAALVGIPIGFIGAYAVGGPTGFAIGATTELMHKRGDPIAFIAGVNIVLGAILSMLLAAVLDEYIMLPDFDHDSHSWFWGNLHYNIGAFAALSALLCTVAFKPIAAAAASATAPLRQNDMAGSSHPAEQPRRLRRLYPFLAAAIAVAIPVELWFRYISWAGFWDGFISDLQRAQIPLFTAFNWVSLALGCWFTCLGFLARRWNVTAMFLFGCVAYLMAVAVTVTIDQHYRSYLMDDRGG